MRKKCAFIVSSFAGLKTRVSKILLLIAAVLGSTIAFSQNKTVTGTVIDSATGEGIGGSSVSVKNMSRGIITDSKGAFKIEAAENSLLEISSIGYKTAEVKSGLNEPLQIRLASANASPITANDVTMDFILDERVRELIAEENRRMTLMRTKTLLTRVQGRGMKITGLTESHLLLPIPELEIQLNKDAPLEQNPGY